MSTKKITLTVDNEYNAETFWAAIDAAFPAIADDLRGTGKATVTREEWAAIGRLPGFAAGPAHARYALIKVS